IVGHPPSLGLLLPLRCHGSAPGSTALLSGSPRRAASTAQDRSHTQADGRYETVLDAQESTGWLEDPPSHPILKDGDEVLPRWVIELLVRKVGTDHGSNLTWRLTCGGRSIPAHGPHQVTGRRQVQPRVGRPPSSHSRCELPISRSVEPERERIAGSPGGLEL